MWPTQRPDVQGCSVMQYSRAAPTEKKRKKRRRGNPPLLPFSLGTSGCSIFTSVIGVNNNITHFLRCDSGRSKQSIFVEIVSQWILFLTQPDRTKCVSLSTYPQMRLRFITHRHSSSPSLSLSFSLVLHPLPSVAALLSEALCLALKKM